jgi:hypothetical protein
VFDVNQFKHDDDGGTELEKRGDNEQEQIIFKPLFAEPTSHEMLIPDGENPQDGPTLLTSSISTNKLISVFASYVRDNVEISQKFNSKSSQSIVFAPTDLAIEQLTLKPWQFPTPLEDDTKSEQEVDKIIAANTNDFVLSHIVDGTVPVSVSGKHQKGVQLTTANGKAIKLVNDDGDYYVAATKSGSEEDWIKVEHVINVDNGALLIISKCLTSP